MSYTAAAREAWWHTWLLRVDPLGVLPERERERRTIAARRAHMARISAAGVAARRRRAA